MQRTDEMKQVTHDLADIMARHLRDDADTIERELEHAMDIVMPKMIAQNSAVATA